VRNFSFLGVEFTSFWIEHPVWVRIGESYHLVWFGSLSFPCCKLPCSWKWSYNSW